MTPEEKQLELQRHYDILLATLDYIISKQAGSFVLDNKDNIRDHYEQEKIKIEKYFEQKRLDRLQQKIAKLTKGLETTLSFGNFIKEKTGYDIDIFDNLRNRVDTILRQNEIRNDKEQSDIGTMLQYLINTSSSTERIERLKSLLVEYFHKNSKKKNEYSEVSSRVEEDGIVTETITFSSGPKPKHFEQVKVISPDGLRKLFIIQWSDGTHTSTSVTLQFANGASGVVYAVKGNHSDITASWKDNFTVSIHINTKYETMAQHNKVRSFDDCINILYIAADN